MAVKIGNNDITLKLGSADVSAAYIGDTLVYSGSTPPTPTGNKWLATYSDSHTESAECDSTSAITQGEINKTNLVSVEIGDCVTSIGYSAFQGCSSLTSIDIPDSVTSFGYRSFYRCSGLTSCSIGSGVTSIGDGAFDGCSSLTSVTIPNSVTSIGSGAFINCSSLTSITVNATTPPTLGSYAFEYTNDCPIIVSCESLETFKSAWSTYASRITCIPSCNDLVLPDGDYFTANTTDKSIQIPYSGVSSNDITVVECGKGYLEFNSVDSNYIYLDIVNSPKDGAGDCINIRINGDKCRDVYVDFVDSGGGLEQIPTGTDMVQYYGRYIKRIVINDTTVPNGETSINQAWVGDSIYFNYGMVFGNGQFQGISSLPIDFTPTNPVVLSSFIGLGSTLNPFNDLQIEWVI